MKREVYEFISKETNDPIVEWRICRRTGKEFPIFNSEKFLLEKISPIIVDKKYQLSLPQLSPEARQMKRLIWRNERKFYKFINSQGKSEISTIASQMWLKIVSQSEFYDYDHLQYGLSYSGDLFDDMWKLFKNMPYPSKLNNNMENSEYCNQESDDKNCYLNAWWHRNENSMYTTYSLDGLRIVDNYRVMNSEYVYESFNIHKSQKVFFSWQIENSYNIWFSRNMQSCQNVIFWFGLTNSNYVYKNKILPKEERENLYKSYKEKISSYEWLLEVKKEYQEFIKDFPLKWTNITNSENSIWGNDLINVKNIMCCSRWEDSKDISYSHMFGGVSDCIDIESVGRAQKNYNFASSIKTTDCIVGSHIVENIQNWYYVYASKNSSCNMACVWLAYKKYCFLNKEYDKNQREHLTIKAIEELQSKWIFWEFFEPKDSPFPYNDSVAMDYFPVNRVIINGQEEIINSNWIWNVTVLFPEKFISDAILDLWWEEKIKIKRRVKEQEINIKSWIETIKAQELTDNISNVTDDILNKAIVCEISWRPFRIVWLELDFYRKHWLPIPHKHYDVRHEERLAKISWRHLNLVNCDKCGNKMLSSHLVNIRPKVYCETCYNKEIYG